MVPRLAFRTLCQQCDLLKTPIKSWHSKTFVCLALCPPKLSFSLILSHVDMKCWPWNDTKTPVTACYQWHQPRARFRRRDCSGRPECLDANLADWCMWSKSNYGLPKSVLRGLIPHAAIFCISTCLFCWLSGTTRISQTLNSLPRVISEHASGDGRNPTVFGWRGGLVCETLQRRMFRVAVPATALRTTTITN